MQFAYQAISLFISGVFALVWIAIFAYSFMEPLDYNCFKFVMGEKIDGGFIAAFFTFIIFPLSYLIGNFSNAFANKLVGKADKKIRAYKFCCKYNIVPHCGDTAAIAKRYHEYRYEIYSKRSDLYHYLSFHREIIRVLRASGVNFIIIHIALFWMHLGRAHVYAAGYAIGLFFILSIFFQHFKFYKPNNDKSSENTCSQYLNAYITAGVIIWGAFLFSVIHLSKEFSPETHILIPYTSFITYMISLCCFWAWRKQQADFYEAVITAHNTLFPESKDNQNTNEE